MPQNFQAQISLDSLRRYRPRPTIAPEGALPGDINLPVDQPLPEVPSREDPLNKLSEQYQPQAAPTTLDTNRLPESNQWGPRFPQRGAGPAVVPDDRQFTTSVGGSATPYDGGDLPKVPAAPPRQMSPQFQANVPSPREMGNIEANSINPSAHWTTPSEESGWAATRKMGNTDSALQGLRSSQPQDAPWHLPMRNQAMVEMYAHKMGLGPNATNGSMSERDLQQAEHEFSRHQDEMERLKAMSPLAVQQTQNMGQLAVERAKIGGQQASDEAYRNWMQEQQDKGIGAGTKVGSGKYSISESPLSQMLAPGSGKGAEDSYAKVKKQLDDLPISTPSGHSPAELAYQLFQQPQFNMTLEERRADLTRKVAQAAQALQGNYVPAPSTAPAPPAASPMGQVPIRKPAPDGVGIAESTDGGKSWHRIMTDNR